MTEPNDDDYVSIEEDYAEYDREWVEENNITGSYTQLRFSDHELWPEIQADGWTQEEFGWLVKFPPGVTTARGYGQTLDETIKGYHGDSSRNSAGLFQFIFPVWNRQVTRRDEFGGEYYNPINAWRHVIDDTRVNETEMTYPESHQINQRLQKFYPTLGEALDEARRRERGGGYQDYEIEGKSGRY